MKQYLLSILYLLAALVQPAIAQNSPQTKAAPGEPVMPYVVTIVQPTETGISNLLTATTDYPVENTSIASGAFAYNDKEVEFKITDLPQGYFPADGFPKVYQTNTPSTAVTTTYDSTAKSWTFPMPKAPVTIEVQYIKVDDLDLSKLSGTGDITLDYTDAKWTYTIDSKKTQFTGTIKGKGTRNLKITSTEGSTLLLANGTELTGNIKVATGETYLSLFVEKAGTATVKGNITATGGRLKCDGIGRLNIYGKVTGDNIENLMQWTWTAAPAAGKTITISTPLEQVLTTFKADGNQKTFASNFPTITSVKVKVGEDVQQDRNDKTTFSIAFGNLTSFSDMANSTLRPVEQPDGITIIGEDKYKDGKEAGEKPFSGTVTGNVSTIKIDAVVTNNPVIILDKVKGETSTINVAAAGPDTGAEVTLALKGTNEVKEVSVGAGSTLTLTTVVGGGSFAAPPTITNAGTFISETSLIKTVGGNAPLNVTGEPTGKEITANQSHTMTVVAAIPGTATDITLSYQWQSYNKESKEWKDIRETSSTSQLRAEPVSSPTSANYATSAVGTYRCAITSQKDAVKTTLYTKAAEVTLKSDPGPGPGPDPTPDPDPTPTKYSVTLPAVTGATTDPVAGVYQVDPGSDFAFSLTLGKDYDQSKPVVKNSRGETITPRTTDGKYVVTSVREDITIQITGIMSNIPTGIAGTEIGDRVWGAAGQLCIHTDSPKSVYVYNVRGQLQKVVDALNGDINVPLPAGNYIVVVGNKSYKVQVSR